MLKTFGWATAGLIVVAAIWALLVSEMGAGDRTALTARVSQIEASQEAFASKHAALVREAAALREQVDALSAALHEIEIARQQSNPVASMPTELLNDQNPETTGALLSGNSLPDEAGSAPRSLQGIKTTPGQLLVYQVTGSTQGPVWGTDIYTDDSSIAAAAVHAGLLQPDETGTIMVTILPGRDTYRGSARYGVASKDYLSWARSYSLQRL